MKVNLSYIDYQLDVFFNWPQGIKYKIIPKGRRSGITKGAGNAVIELLADRQGPLLWGDTIHGNIDRYFQRYILPELKANNIKFNWESQRKQLTINGHYCDFRSADNPENWEGFGYKLIFLNEAGIILKNRELYTNTVLPMLLDYPDSKLIAAGVPKGKLLRNGLEHPFFTLYKRAFEAPDRYQTKTFTSFANPLLDEAAIRELENEMGAISPSAIRQEIYGEFIEVDAINPFAYALDKQYHFDESVEIDWSKPIVVSVDFNLIPFACLVANIYTDRDGFHLNFVHEISIQQGSIPDMAEAIKVFAMPVLHSMKLTGDAMGRNRNITQRDNASNYEMLRRIIGLRTGQVIVPPNPTHEKSRNDFNYLLHISAKKDSQFHVKINPKKCPVFASEIQITQCDAEGGIIKRDRSDMAQRADQIDNGRYIVNTFCQRELEQHQKSNFGRFMHSRV